MNDIPVILITYNRLRHTAQVLEALKKHNIRNIFIFSDAPRNEHDEKGVFETRNLFKEITWTTPKIICQRENIGLAQSITNAVNYVFETHDKLIVIEDDCVPLQYFFYFMYECLNRYETNERIFGISGYTIPIGNKALARCPYDNYFFPRICSWGWATWKRAWNRYDGDLKKLYGMSLERGIDLNKGGSDIPLYIESMMQGSLKDVWTLSWQLTVYLHAGYYVYPTRTHLNNIGMDGSGVHRDITDRFSSTAAMTKPTKFAPEIFLDNRIANNIKSFYDVRDKTVTIHHIKSLLKNLAARLLR